MKKPTHPRPFDIAELARIVAWLEEAGLHAIEIEESGRSVRIVMAGGGPAGSGPVETVAARTTGVFLAAHPDRGADFVRTGDRVRAGDVVALLGIGRLIVPVTAPADGTILRRRIEPGTVVGYGTALFEFRPVDPVQPSER